MPLRVLLDVQVTVEGVRGCSPGRCRRGPEAPDWGTPRTPPGHSGRRSDSRGGGRCGPGGGAPSWCWPLERSRSESTEGAPPAQTFGHTTTTHSVTPPPHI
eukprot:353073-Prorocentrum_minimum.AAC.1